MRRDLAGSIDRAVWPYGLRLRRFDADCARQAHDLMRLAYTAGGGEVAPFATWWRDLQADIEFDPLLCFAVEDREAEIVGFAQCWTGAFVKDLVVHPLWRRRGVGRALLLTVFDRFRQRGAAAVELKVTSDNPSGALAFYQSLGMREIG